MVSSNRDQSTSCSGAALWGLLFTFFLIRLFHFHQHTTPLMAPEDTRGGVSSPGTLPHEHRTSARQESTNSDGRASRLGLAIHTLLDGIALGCSGHGRLGP